MAVYFVGCGEYVKIGTARDHLVSSRFSALQTAHPEEITLLGTVPGGVDVERTLHGLFREYRVRGEWFLREGRLRSFIERGFDDFSAPFSLFDCTDEALGLLGAAPFERSFYRVYVRVGQIWWRFQWDASPSRFDPIEYQKRIEAPAKSVHGLVRDLKGYECDPDRAALVRLMQRVCACEECV